MFYVHPFNQAGTLKRQHFFVQAADTHAAASRLWGVKLHDPGTCLTAMQLCSLPQRSGRVRQNVVLLSACISQLILRWFLNQGSRKAQMQVFSVQRSQAHADTPA